MVCFAILPDVQVGRVKAILNWWDRFIPHSKEEVVGEEIEKRLRKFVEKVNDSPEIQFVISVGDLTDTASKGQFRVVKKIMKGLKKPWLPLLGNHDVWPYERDKSGKVIWNAKTPIIFNQFKNFFKKGFDRIFHFFENWEEQGEWLGNFAFSHHGIRFIIVDNVNRRKSPLGLPGAAGWSRLYPESEKWLIEQVAKSEEKTIVVVSHAPLKMRLLKQTGEKTILAIAGHRHKYQVEENGIVSIVTNALYVEPGFPLVTITKNGTPLIEFQKM